MTADYYHCFVLVILGLQVFELRKSVETIDAAARPEMYDDYFIHEFASEGQLATVEPVMAFWEVNYSFLSYNTLCITLKLRPLTKSSSLAR